MFAILLSIPLLCCVFHRLQRCFALSVGSLLKGWGGLFSLCISGRRGCQKKLSRLTSAKPPNCIKPGNQLIWLHLILKTLGTFIDVSLQPLAQKSNRVKQGERNVLCRCFFGRLSKQCPRMR